jgi:ubiquinone/menaquinone biosynthesis C-methylase UbiE
VIVFLFGIHHSLVPGDYSMDGTALSVPARADYGIDAPGVVRNLGLIGIVGIIAGNLIGWLMGDTFPTVAAILSNWLGWGGFGCLVSAVAMLLSSKVGKMRERDRLLDAIRWQGDERVLDVGCGRGLLLIGAARRLPSGTAVGVDIWQTSDQSGNSPDTTLANARAEGVADRIELVTGDARSLPFQESSFDAVVSNLALHNIPDAEGRAQAVREIARVVKPGGILRLSDFQHTADYVAALQQLGWSDVRRSGLHFRIYPPVRVVMATKPAGATTVR